MGGSDAPLEGYGALWELLVQDQAGPGPGVKAAAAAAPAATASAIGDASCSLRLCTLLAELETSPVKRTMRLLQQLQVSASPLWRSSHRPLL